MAEWTILHALPVLWRMCDLMVDMDETPVHVWQCFNLVLEVLTNVMCAPQRHMRVKHDVDLNDKVRARVIHSYRVNHFDVV